MRRRTLMAAGGSLAMVLWLCPVWHVLGQDRPALTIGSESALLMSRTKGRILFDKNPDKRFPPASLAKMMTLYLAFEAIKRGEARFDDEVVVSERAWKMGGSQMFLQAGDRVKLVELIKGCATVSANDGAMAIAEFLAGSEEAFVQEMNEKARALGMKDTRFANPHGLPRGGQHTTAADMAVLGFEYVHAHPDALKFHALPTLTYRDIEQRNRNPLLRRNQGVDGLKTGYLRTSGYHILFSVKRDGDGLIGVVMGGTTARSRNRDALKLIAYGLKSFSTRTQRNEGEILGRVQDRGPERKAAQE